MSVSLPITLTSQCAPAVPSESRLSDAGLSLSSLFRAYRRRILFTYGLLLLESLLALMQPWMLGVAIASLLASSHTGLVLWGIQHITFLGLATLRRRYDTRTFTGIYAELASTLVAQQRQSGVNVSTATARSALARELVSFFERDVPFVLQVGFAVVGSLVMLAFCDWLLLPCCLLLLVPVIVLSKKGAATTITVTRQLNDQLEREVTVIERNQPSEVREHFERLAFGRVKLSDWEATSFAWMQFLVLGLLALTLGRCCSLPGTDAGQIFQVFGYVLMFAGNLGSVPMVVQQFSNLRDIQRRVSASAET